jgi:hypothetical protein
MKMLKNVEKFFEFIFIEYVLYLFGLFLILDH